jgi:hypothetical protein
VVSGNCHVSGQGCPEEIEHRQHKLFSTPPGLEFWLKHYLGMKIKKWLWQVFLSWSNAAFTAYWP